MEVGQRLKDLRAEAHMSQDDLAARVYVSRQTISSWENGKTYPDVQSLLLLSEIFDVTVDSLIKGDVEAMTKTVDSDVRTMKRLSYVMTVFIVLTVIACGWFSFQVAVWDWPIEQAVPTILLALVLWGIAMFAALWAERIKKEHDLITYREVLAYWNGKPVDRDTEKGRMERTLPRRVKTLRTIGWTVVALIIGAAFGVLVSGAIDMLWG